MLTKITFKSFKILRIINNNKKIKMIKAKLSQD